MAPRGSRADTRWTGSDVFCYRRSSDVHPRQLVKFDAVRGHALPPANATMRMTHDEGRGFFGLLTRSRRYLEWGAGGTTVVTGWRATHPTMPRIEAHTVENNAEFIEHLRAQTPQIRQAEDSGALAVHVADLGPLNRLWGTPANWSARPTDLRAAQARAYVEAPLQSRCCFDTILIDGRFRQACALQALQLAHEHTTVLLHDFFRLTGAGGKVAKLGNHHRSGYNRTVGKFYEHVQRLDTMAVLRPRPGAIAAAKAGLPEFMRALGRVIDDVA
jgi:hypothetical protein